MRMEEMALRESVLDDYSDFGEEFERLMAMEIADAVIARGNAAGEISLIDAIEAAWNRSNVQSAPPEYSPDEIGQLPGYSRASAIRSAEAHAMSSVGRQPIADRINSRLIGPLLHHIALWSDNPYGRCTIGAQRHAEYMGCSERQCRSLIIQMVNDGIIHIEVRPGQTPALWLRYPHAIIAASPMQISEAIAPPRRSPGRPSSVEKPRKSCLPEDSPASNGKPRNSYVPEYNAEDQKTPEVKDENPGSQIDKPRNYSASDCKNSLQDLKARTHSEESAFANEGSHAPETPLLVIDEGRPTKRKSRSTGKRPWDWVHESERERLGEICKAYALERSWPTGHLRDRLVAFDNHQRIHKSVSADWEASLLQWLGDPRFQPRSSRSAGRKGFAEIAAEQFGLDGDL
ncbi:hypothetical protein [Hyphomicrobium sp. DY-1]|uniref:hypothetical protein n=1 Tax=Hyphomicrobium sp. DY-1 TaxID=3075650 RepID=UPI0039C4D722